MCQSEVNEALEVVLMATHIQQVQLDSNGLIDSVIQNNYGVMFFKSPLNDCKATTFSLFLQCERFLISLCPFEVHNVPQCCYVLKRYSRTSNWVYDRSVRPLRLASGLFVTGVTVLTSWTPVDFDPGLPAGGSTDLPVRRKFNSNETRKKQEAHWKQKNLLHHNTWILKKQTNK